MCLYQTINDRSDSSGRLCVKSQEFLAASDLDGSFMANGVIGLGPSKDDRSIIRHLFLQGQIMQAVVGLNYEDPQDRMFVS